ncbi:hypothetical protein P153DRAFT_371705 [Dothidotthia symphoricarpi CBS 119687]|uniref:Uncharacterized protein n=1 Tax=Dothidotthia symphoricarpi CBS 119687 TaxID=1392245 RepID=A0A6A5ZWW4_9PLEO|nr:uncharacterized protein P153DRAFT_371705 [Dothidotthia symphoricarpi CBS 119687]KAF2123383.1 hypothetical protein P153DRAFT_371705 [Dothidotthia symphoricarpi CBS 119687]
MGMNQKGEGWLGLPFLFAGALFVVALSLLSAITNPEEGGYEAISDVEREGTQ